MTDPLAHARRAGAAAVLARNAARARADAERLGCSVDEALLLDQTQHGCDPDYLARLRTRAEAYGCRVETLIVVDLHKGVQRGLALLDGDD